MQYIYNIFPDTSATTYRRKEASHGRGIHWMSWRRLLFRFRPVDKALQEFDRRIAF